MFLRHRLPINLTIALFSVLFLFFSVSITDAYSGVNKQSYHSPIAQKLIDGIDELSDIQAVSGTFIYVFTNILSDEVYSITKTFQNSPIVFRLSDGFKEYFDINDRILSVALREYEILADNLYLVFSSEDVANRSLLGYTKIFWPQFYHR